MSNAIQVKSFGWGTEETFADNQYFLAKYVFMDAEQEAPISSVTATDTLTLYVIGGALIVTYFEPNNPKEQTAALCTGTNFEIPANTQYYLGTGTEQSAEFVEVRRGTYK